FDPSRPLALFLVFPAKATSEPSTLSLHDALPICRIPPNKLVAVPNGIRIERFQPADDASRARLAASLGLATRHRRTGTVRCGCRDRKSTRLNSSHVKTPYAFFCLKKKQHNVACRQ